MLSQLWSRDSCPLGQSLEWCQPPRCHHPLQLVKLFFLMRSQDSWVTQPACSRLCDPDLGSSHDHKGFHLDTPPISTPPHPPLPTHQGCAVIFPCRVPPPSEWWRTSKYSTAPHLRFLPVPSCPLLKCLLSQSAVPYESVPQVGNLSASSSSYFISLPLSRRHWSPQVLVLTTQDQVSPFLVQRSLVPSVPLPWSLSRSCGTLYSLF